jgi:cyclic pyranopterin phosphate synthase
LTELYDSSQRPINYLRISVTDRCNLRCIYCMPPEGVNHLLHEDVLRYEEIYRVAQAAAALGMNKIRLTGGEPLVRAHLTRLVGMLSNIEGIDDISMTTNGVLLRQHADSLKAAGLDRVNISLDSLDRERFTRITRHDRQNDVLDGIAAAKESGLDPVKINMVVIRGVNDNEVIGLARRTIEDGWNVRFIEQMPIGEGKKLSFVPTSEVMERLHTLGELEPCLPKRGNGPAKYFRFNGASGTIGFISPITEHICFNCNRMRLTVDGKLRPCLMSDDEVDLRESLRSGASIEELKGLIQQAVARKPRRHRLSEGVYPTGWTMSQVGG